MPSEKKHYTGRDQIVQGFSSRNYCISLFFIMSNRTLCTCAKQQLSFLHPLNTRPEINQELYKGKVLRCFNYKPGSHDT